MFKSIKTLVKNIQKDRIFVSVVTSLLFTALILFIFNFEPHDNPMLPTKWLKNIIIGVLLFTSFFVISYSDHMITSYKKTIEERDRYIDELESLIVEKELRDKAGNKDLTQ